MTRAITQVDVLAAYENFANAAVASFNRKGKVAPRLFCLTLGDKEGDVKAMGDVLPMLKGSGYGSVEEKDQLAWMIKLLLMKGSPLRGELHEKGAPLADLVVQVSEAWLVVAKTGTVDAALEHARKTSLEHYPGRTEGILVAVHSATSTDIGTCPILEKPRRAEYAPMQPPAERYEGRFTMGTS